MRTYTVIPDRLYLSAAFGHLANRRALLEAHEIDVVVSMWGPKDPELGIEQIHMPIPDGKRLAPEPLLAVARECAQRIAGGQRILVHCRGGRNRSALMAALILTAYTGMSGRQAIRLLRSRRPNALANEQFVEYLRGIPARQEESK